MNEVHSTQPSRLSHKSLASSAFDDEKSPLPSIDGGDIDNDNDIEPAVATATAADDDDNLALDNNAETGNHHATVPLDNNLRSTPPPVDLATPLASTQHQQQQKLIKSTHAPPILPASSNKRTANEAAAVTVNVPSTAAASKSEHRHHYQQQQQQQQLQDDTYHDFSHNRLLRIIPTERFFKFESMLLDLMGIGGAASQTQLAAQRNILRDLVIPKKKRDVIVLFVVLLLW